MVQVMSSPAAFLRANQMLPEELRQSCLRVEFVEPIPKVRATHFYRIRLTALLMENGEDEYYMPEIVQANRLKNQVCTRCRRSLKRTDVQTSYCETKGCEHYGRAFHTGPVRGVVKVQVTPEDVAGVELVTSKGGVLKVGRHQYQIPGAQQSVEMIKAATLMLDRRYKPEVLVAIGRTVDELGLEVGWSIRT